MADTIPRETGISLEALRVLEEGVEFAFCSKE